MQPLTATDLELARAWLWRSRAHFPPNADIWQLRYHWPVQVKEIVTALNDNRYQLQPMQRVATRQGDRVIWSSRDALVLRWLTEQLTPLLPVHPHCEHVRGHGGGPASCVRLHHHLRRGDSRFVCRTDIKGYYANIDKKRLLDAAARYVACPCLMELLRQFVYYSVEWGGNFHTPRRGIARASSLSPLLAAFYLYEMDVAFTYMSDTRYIRYMDDFVILTRTRWQLRRAVRRLNQWFQLFGMQQHPGKTFIGRVDKGFDWMGFQLANCGLIGIGLRAQQNHVRKGRRLYEQLQNRPADERDGRMAIYEQAWLTWATRFSESLLTNPPCV